MIRIVEYIIQSSDLEPLEKTLKENRYTFNRWDTGAYRPIHHLTGRVLLENHRDMGISHSTRGEEGRLVHYAGTPIGGGGIVLTLLKGEDSELGRILSNLHKELKK